MRNLDNPSYTQNDLSIGIVHFGVGNFHRSHQAMYLDRLLNEGDHKDWGICGIGVLPGDVRMRDVLAQQHNTYTLVEKSGDMQPTARTIGSICGYLFAPDDPEAVLRLLSADSTRIVSLTITEGGYNIDRSSGEFDLNHPAIRHDLHHPEAPKTVFGFITAAIKRRMHNGQLPFTVMSCDNVPEN